MKTASESPKTLLEAIRYFSDLDVATEFFANLRWPDGPVCPRCGFVKDHYYTKPRRLRSWSIVQGAFHPLLGGAKLVL